MLPEHRLVHERGLPRDARPLDPRGRPRRAQAERASTERANLQAEILLSWLNFANGAFQYTQTAEDVVAFAELAFKNSAATKDDLNTVRGALSQLEDAQQTAYWLGVDKVDPLQAGHVLQAYKQVVDKLQAILKNRSSGLSASSVRQLIDEVNAAALALTR